MKTGIALIISFVLFLGGLLLMGIAVELPAWQALVFFSGIVAVALSFAIPIHVLPLFD
ncbi:hypothetical protein [Leifsonia poae]|uniref:hypothetical protein n=1 Tax=Leifsonia poae TaxID=110933 RepID=UPI003D66BD45